MLVDDDAGAPYEEYYRAALETNNINYDYWEVAERGSPNIEALGMYNRVVWFTGDEYDDTLLPADQTALAEYLDGGGDLFLSGQDIGYDIGSTAFYADYLHTEFLQDEMYEYQMLGQGEFAAIDFVLNDDASAGNQAFPSSIAPADEQASSTFDYETGECGGVFANTDSYKVIYLAFGLEGAGTATTRAAVIEKAFSLFDACSPHGALMGQVRETNTNEPIPGAVITTTDGVRAFSDADGYYDMPLVPGSYTVTASLPDLSAQSVANIQINAYEFTRQDFTLSAPVLELSTAVLNMEVLRGAFGHHSMIISNSGSAELEYELQIYDSDYLNVSPAAGTIPDGRAAEITILSDATNIDAGMYDAVLHITSNAPRLPHVDVPIVLTVLPNRDIAVLRGTVTAADTGDPLAATISLTGTQTGSFVTDEYAGMYARVLLPGEYYLTASASGYMSETTSVTLETGDARVRDFQLYQLSPRIELSPAAFTETVNMGEMITRNLIISNIGNYSLSYVLSDGERGYRPVAIVQKKSETNLVPNRREPTARYDPNARSTRGQFVESDNDTENTNDVIPTTAGDIISSFEPDVGRPWGVGFEVDTLWVGDNEVNENVQFTEDGAPTGEVIYNTWSEEWAADMAWDENHDLLWQVNVGGDNCLYGISTPDGAVEEIICNSIWTEYSQRGVAYDYDTDTFYIGGWNDDVIYHVAGLDWNEPGEILDQNYFGYISGLAWHGSGYLYVATNDSESELYQVDPLTGDSLRLIEFPGDSSYAGAGIEFDEECNLWVMNQENDYLYLVDVDEPGQCSAATDAFWLREEPISDTVAVNSAKAITVTFDASAITQPGAYNGYIRADSNDPYSSTVEVPIEMNVTPPPDAGKIAGMVRDARSNNPVRATIKAFNGLYTYTLSCDRDGSYEGWVKGGNYSVLIGAPDYVTSARDIVVEPQEVVTYNFALTPDAPWMRVTAATLEENLDFGTTASHQGWLTITNSGAQPLEFAIRSLPRNIEASAASVAMAAVDLDKLPRLKRVSPYGKEKIDPTLAEELESASRAAPADAAPVEFIIVFKERADLSRAYDIANWEARGQFVLNALRKVATASQAEILGILNGAKNAETVHDYRSYYIVNAVLVRGSRSTALTDLAYSLAQRDDVAYLRGNYQHSTIPPKPGIAQDTIDDVEWSIAMIRADEVWDELGVTGEGAVVANIDSGVRWTHEALRPHYRGWNGATADHNYNWWDPSNTFGSEPGDSDGHGTHTMGTMVGGDGVSNFIGVAPGAQWIATSGCHTCYESDLLESGEWVIAPWDLSGDTATADPTKRPHVVNNSWGSVIAGDSDTWYLETVEAWRAAGIFPAWSAGNSGDEGCGSVSAPGNYDASFASGAVDSSGDLAYFSSLGPSPFIDGEVKPNIAAPGVDVRSSYNGSDSDYETASGTSMASPHTAGVVALLISANPNLIGNIEAIENVLMESAAPVAVEVCGEPASVPNYAYGWGRLDAYEAVARTAANTSWLAVDPVTGTVHPGASLGVQVTFDARQAPPGQYGAMLSIDGNDPYTTATRLPVTLTVRPADNMGILRGTVTDEATSTPLRAKIDVENAYSMHADPETGEYSGYYIAGTYNITVTMSGYVSQTATVQVGAQTTTTRDFVLIADAPVLQTSASSFELPVLTGEYVQVPLTLRNAGARDLTYDIQIPIDEMMVIDSDTPGGPTYQWIDATAGESLYLSDDDYEEVSLPAPFTYYGEAYDSIFVNSNGLVIFGEGSSSYSNRSIPSEYSPNNMIAAFWDDLNPSSGGTVYVMEQDDYFVVEYDAVRHYGSYETETFEVILDYATGDIIVQYQSVSEDDSCTVGVENGDGSAGVEYCYNTAECLHDELAVRFYGNSLTREWLSVTPMSGTLASRESETVQVLVDARAITVPGTYDGKLLLSSNDPAQPQLPIPVRMLAGSSIDVGVSQELPGFIRLGEVITYAIHYANLGTVDVNHVFLADQLPEEMEYRADDSDFYHQGGSTGPIQWYIGDLAAGASGSIIVTAQVVGTGLDLVELQALLGRHITNTVVITAAQTELDATNNTHSASMMLAEPDVSIEINTPGAVDPGETFQYSITYANTGYVDAHNVYITETLPAELEFIADNSGLFRQMPDSGTIVWWLATLPMQTQHTFTVTVRVREDVAWDTIMHRSLSISTATREFISMNNTASTRMIVGEWRVFIPVVMKD